jgi:citrate lyase subunit beta / citryl-CoA lyase
VIRFAMGPALLFCPADRPDRFDKASKRADAGILDLEDAVDPANRAAAREALLAHPLDPATTIVRINAVDSEDFAVDVAALASTDYRTVMLPKASSAREAAALADYDVVALCETAAGVAAAAELASCQNVVALMWGAEDLIASLGGTSSRFADGRYREVARYARSAVLVAAGAGDKAAIDAVHLEIGDSPGLSAEAADAAASGFAATACIHPDQVGVIRSAYRPSAEEIAVASELLDAASRTSGVFRFRGRMIDGPVLRHAEVVLRRAGV